MFFPRLPQDTVVQGGQRSVLAPRPWLGSADEKRVGKKKYLGIFELVIRIILPLTFKDTIDYMNSRRFWRNRFRTQFP